MKAHATDRALRECRFAVGALFLIVFSPSVISAAKQSEKSPAAAIMDDREISDVVERELGAALAVPAELIVVSTADGIVTLSGKVPSLLAKERCARVAQTVKGVRAVVNQVEVKDSQRSDADIRSDVVAALLVDPATEAFQIDVKVAEGAVTLGGTVDSWQERRLAEKVAAGVRGVRKLDNAIRLQTTSKRADDEIKKDIEGVLRWDRFVDDALIVVEVDDGRVRLSGTAGSAAEKNRAELDAYVAGVSSVDAKDLQVRLWDRKPELRSGKYVNKSDAELKQVVAEAFLYDPRVKPFNVDVSVQNGVVTLRGQVSNLKACDAAAQVARDTVGVWRVENRLKIRSKNQPTDDQLETKVRQALLRDPYVERYKVTVTALDGRIYLSGTVDSLFEKGQAEDAASRVAGVLGVRNNLEVQYDGPLAYNPYVYDWYPYDYDWYAYDDVRVTRRSDWAIHDDIESQLWWSPFVDADEVEVKVDDGVATLTGTVDTWSERLAAAENALEGGAVKVVNRLKVSYGPPYFMP